MQRIVSRLYVLILTIVAVASISFVLIRALPGGPIAYFRAQLAQAGMDPSAAEVLAAEYIIFDPDDPLWIQYLQYLGNLFQGDMGISILYRENVSSIYAEAIPWTIFYMSISIMLTFLIGILLGAIMAYWEGSRFDLVNTLISLTLNSIPYYVIAILLLYFLAYQAGWFPIGRRVDARVETGVTLEFFLNALYHAALPIASMVIAGFGGWALAMRGNSISVLGSDYMRVARLRGLPTRRIASTYVARNAVLPLYTQLMIGIGFMFGGSIILEEIFRYRGVGWFLYSSIGARDFNLMMGGFLIITVAVAVGIFIADITYGLIDPRAGGGQQRETFLTTDPEGWFKTKYQNLKTRILGGNEPGSVGIRSDSLARADTASVAADVEFESGDTGTSKYRILWQDFRAAFVILWNDRRAKFGMIILAFYGILGTLGVWYIDPPQVGQGPSRIGAFQDWSFPIGTNHHGQDLLAMHLYAIPPMFKMIFAGAVFATVVAVLVGTVSGYIGGTIDRILSTITDIVMTIPGLPLVIVLAVFFEPRNPYLLGLLLAINQWTGLARSIRSQVLTLRNEAHVEAMRTMGISTWTTIYHNILPNIMPYVTINFAYNARNIIFSAVGLYYLGVLPHGAADNWGIILDQAYSQGALYSLSSAYWIVTPAVAILMLTLAMILIAQGTDRVFNPRIRSRHMADIDDGKPEGDAGTEPQTGVRI